LLNTLIYRATGFRFAEPLSGLYREQIHIPFCYTVGIPIIPSSSYLEVRNKRRPSLRNWHLSPHRHLLLFTSQIAKGTLFKGAGRFNAMLLLTILSVLLMW